MQYMPLLETSGFRVQVAPFFDDDYLQNLYAGRRNYLNVLRYFTTRISAMRHQPPADLLWIEYEAMPWVPWLFEQHLLPRKIPIVSDYDDAIFHQYDQHSLAPVRWLLGRKIDNFMASSDLVLAGNPYLADRAKKAGAKHISIVPTVVNTEEYEVRSSGAGAQDCLRVGWIGTPQTWSALAAPIYKTIAKPLEQFDAVFRAIGADLHPRIQERLEIIPWSEKTEVPLVQSMDIGLMPLPDTSWTQGKCGFKLLQYMACGLPVVASPVGVNRQIVEHGVNGFLANNEQEWQQAVTTLLGDSALRKRMGIEGRKKVEEQYSLQSWGPKVVDSLKRLVDKSGNIQ